MILAVDPGLADCGWAVVAPRTGHVAALGVVHQERSPKRDESTCRATRSRRQARELALVVVEHGCTAIAAEAMSFGGPPKARFAMAVALGLSWGVLAAIASALELELYELPPKRWQHAVLGRSAEDRTAVDYDQVFAELARFMGRSGRAADELAAIPCGRRNHALDAVGVGVFTALRPSEATRIAEPTSRVGARSPATRTHTPEAGSPLPTRP